MTITYCDPDGTEHPIEAEIGKHLLDVAHDNNIELEGKFCLFRTKDISSPYRTKRTLSNATFFCNDTTIECIPQGHVVENWLAPPVTLCLNKKFMIIFHQKLMKKRTC